MVYSVPFPDFYIDFWKERYGLGAEGSAYDTLKNHLKPFKQIKDDFLPANDIVEESEKMLKSMGDDEGLDAENLKRVREYEKDSSWWRVLFLFINLLASLIQNADFQ